MSEYASRGRGHSHSHSSGSSPVQTFKAPERTPAEKASDAVTALSREVAAVDRELDAVSKAKAANDPRAWHEAKDRVSSAVALATKDLEKARALSSDASDQTKQQLADAERTLEEKRNAAASLGDAPRGWNEVSRETEILAVLEAPIQGGAHVGFAQKEQALKAEFAQLSPAESKQLISRLSKPDAADPVAQQFTKLTGERRERLIDFLRGARKREALRNERKPVASKMAASAQPVSAASVEQAKAALDWQPNSVLIEKPEETAADDLQPEPAPKEKIHDAFDNPFINKDQAAGATEAKELSNTATMLYLSKQWPHVWSSVSEYVSGLVWPQVSERLNWKEGVFTKLLLEEVDGALGSFKSGATAGLGIVSTTFDFTSLAQLLYPHDVRGLIEARIPAKNSAQWSPAIGLILSQTFAEVLIPSVQRMSKRYIDAADALQAAAPTSAVNVQLEQLVTSHPMDRCVARALVTPHVAEVAPDGALAAGTRKPPRLGLRHVNLTWERNPQLWNFVRADIADATPEEVAAELFGYARDKHGDATSYYAYGIAAAPPLFGLPASWAIQFHDAREHAPAAIKAGALPDGAADTIAHRLAVVASSDTGDSLALAQASENADSRAMGMNAGQLAEVFGDCGMQLDHLRGQLRSWGLADDIQAEIAYIAAKKSSIGHAPADQVASWTSIALAQRDRLYRITGATRQVLDAAGTMGVAPRSAAAAPLRGILSRLAEAAATSHLGTTSDQLLGEAMAEQANLSLRSLQANVVELESSVDFVRAARGSDAAARDRARPYLEAKEEAQHIENQMLEGKEVSPVDLERVQINAQWLSLAARVDATQRQLDDVAALAIKVGAGIMSGFMANNEFKSLPAASMFIHTKLGEVQTALNSHPKVPKAEGPNALPDDIAQRKAALISAQKKFAEISENQDLGKFFQTAYDTVRSQQLRTAIATAVVMIGISMATAGVAGAVEASLEAGYLAAEGVEVASQLSMGARIAVQVGSTSTEIMGNAVGQTLTTAGTPGAGSFTDALIDNAIFVLGAKGTIGVAEHEVQDAVQFEKMMTEELARIESQEARAALAMSTLQKTGRIAAWPLKQAGQLTAHTIMGMALGAVADARKGHAGAETSDANQMTQQALIQGASIAIGRLGHAMFAERMPMYAELANRMDLEHGLELYKEAQHLEQLTEKLTTKPQPKLALEVLAERARVLETEQKALEELASKPAGRGGPSGAELKAMRADLKAQLSESRSEDMLRVQWHLLGLTELAPGLWKGSYDKISASLDEATATGHEVVRGVEQFDGVVRATIDGKPFELNVVASEATPPKTEAAASKTEVPVAARKPDSTRGSSDQISQETVGAFEITASAVPGSSFKGRGENRIEETALLAQANTALDDVAGQRRDITKVEHAYVDPKAKPDAKVIPENTHVVHLADNTSITVRVMVAPLEGQDVAHSVMNPTKQGVTKVERGSDGGAQVIEVEHIKGRYVIQLSNKMDPVHVRRAVAHEVAEILARRDLFLHRKLPGVNALRPGADPSTPLSPHDHGRIAEIGELASEIQSGDAAAKTRAHDELIALVEDMGLRSGVAGADERFAKVKAELSSEALSELAKVRGHEAELPEAEAKKVAWTREEASADRATQKAHDKAHEPSHEMPSTGLDRKATKRERKRLEAKARRAREKLSDETLQHIRMLNEAGIHPKMKVQIGGNASLAARDPGALLIDANQRWAVDSSRELAQTAQQMEPLKAAGFGDPYEFADGDERVPMEAVHFWQDTMAAKGPLIDGRAELGVSSDGKMIVTIRPNDGSAPVVVEVQGVPVISTGFTHENAPGARYKSPRQAILEIEKSLAVLESDKNVGELARKARSRVATLKGINEADAGEALQAIKDVRGALDAWTGPKDKNPKAALDILEATKGFAELRAEDPGHVFYGDEANTLSDEQIAHMQRVVIAGPGGTGISAAEIILTRNTKVHVTMIGVDPPAGLAENDQFRAVIANHGTAELCKSLHIEPGKVDGRFEFRDGYYLGQAKEVNGKYDVNARPAREGVGPLPAEFAQGDTYISALGRFNDLPPPIAAMANQAERAGRKVQFTVLRDPEEQLYVGYRVEIVQESGSKVAIDVTGAASRYIDTTRLSKEDANFVDAARGHDAPPESGLFDGSFAASVRQALRYASYRKAEDY